MTLLMAIILKCVTIIQKDMISFVSSHLKLYNYYLMHSKINSSFPYDMQMLFILYIQQHTESHCSL